jgi:hypothetical protein
VFAPESNVDDTRYWLGAAIEARSAVDAAQRTAAVVAQRSYSGKDLPEGKLILRTIRSNRWCK